MPEPEPEPDPEPEPELEPDPALDEELRAARPDVDVIAEMTHARVVAALFGAAAAPRVRIGRYELETRLGQGGGGVVYAAADPELSRRVAIKLIRSDGQRDRVLAEGRALARLSHPNIVPLHDVGTLGSSGDDRVYLVMELVEGETLRAFVAGAARTVAEVVRVYRQAGEGLAAAHRAGIVHRDFKPDNAIVGADGRVRVVDFGLARTGAPSDGAVAPSDRGGSSDGIHTRAGLGTPRYMAPEQIAGEPLTAATDQFAFCMSLREALTARGARVPRWIEPIVTRGTSRAPDQRFATMTALLAALARDPATVWRRRGLALGALAAVGAAVAAFAVGRSHESGPACDGGPAELAAVWTPATRARVAAHLTELGTPYAAAAAPTLLAAFDTYGRRWLAGHRAACEAHRSGGQSAQLLDQRMACLARARAAFGASIDVATRTDAGGLAKVIEASSSLQSLARCDDPLLLADRGDTPRPEQLAPVAAIEAEIARLEVEILAARPDADTRARTLVARAEAIGHRPLIASALRLQALASGYSRVSPVARSDADRAAMIALYRRAGTLALAAGDLALAVDAFARELYQRGTSAPSAAIADAPVYAALAERLPPSAHAERALLANNLGAVHMALGQRDLARADFERSMAEVAAIQGPVSVELIGLHDNLARAIDDPDRRRTLYAENADALARAIGPEHPLTLEHRCQAAEAIATASDAATALAEPCFALSRLHAGEGVPIANCAFELGWLAYTLGDTTTSRRAYALVVAAPGADEHRVWIARGFLALLDARPADAITTFDAYLKEARSLRASWFASVLVADATLGRALALRTLRKPGAAEALAQARAGYLEGQTATGHPKWARRIAYVDALGTAP